MQDDPLRLSLIPPGPVRYLRNVNRLIEYLRQNLMIDFQGDLSVA